MRRRVISNVAARLKAASAALTSDALCNTRTCFQGEVVSLPSGLATWATARSLSAAPGPSPWQLGGARGFRPAPSMGRSASEPFNMYHDSKVPEEAKSAFPDMCLDQKIEVSARGGTHRVPVQRIPAEEVPAFVKAHLKGLTAEDIRPISEQVIDLHFCEAEEDSLRPSSLVGPLCEVVDTLLSDDSPLRDDGEVVSCLLWGAYRLDLDPANHAHKRVLVKLLLAAERSLDSCRDDGKAIAHVLCGLSGICRSRLLTLPRDYLLRVTQRLGEGGVVQNMPVDYLLLALQGLALLRDRPEALLDILMGELLKKAKEEGLDAVEISRLARFLDWLPQSKARDELAALMLAQTRDNLPFMDVFGIHLLLRCAARLGRPMEPELLQALTKRALSQLGTEGAFVVAGPMLWALSKLGCQVGDAVASHEFVGACIEAHMSKVALIPQGQLRVPFRAPLRGSPMSRALIDFLFGCVGLGVELSPKALDVYVEVLQAQHAIDIDEQEVHSLLNGFKAVNYPAGVEACKARLGI